MIVANTPVTMFDPSTLCDPVVGLWAGDSHTGSPADGAPVTSWRNAGSLGGTFGEALPGSGPLYSRVTAGYNNQPTFTFGGTAALALNIADLAQTWWVLVVGNVGTTGGQRLVGTGNAVTQGVGRTGAGAWTMHAGTAVSAGTANTTKHRFLTKFAGAGSTTKVDGTGTLSGNANTGACTWAVIGAGWDGASLLNGLVGTIAGAWWYTSDPEAHGDWAELQAGIVDLWGLP